MSAHYCLINHLKVIQEKGMVGNNVPSTFLKSAKYLLHSLEGTFLCTTDCPFEWFSEIAVLSIRKPGYQIPKRSNILLIERSNARPIRPKMHEKVLTQHVYNDENSPYPSLTDPHNDEKILWFQCKLD